MTTHSQHLYAQQLMLDERNHVEKPLLDQLSGLGRAIIDNEKEAVCV